MLAGFLEDARDRLVDQADPASDEEAPGSASSGRRARLDALLGELIEDLRRGGARNAVPPAPCCAEVEQHMRDRLRRAVLAEVEQRRSEVSLAELMIVADWSSSVERAQLREKGERLSALLDSLADPVILVSPDARTLYMNRPARQDAQAATGLAPDRMVGKTAAEIGLPPEVVRSSEQSVARAIKGETVASETLFPTSSGERWGENRFTPVYGPEGAVVAVAVVNRDVHERKLAQKRLELLSKVGMLVGLDYDEVLSSIAQVSVPELADWGAVDLVEGEQIRRTFLAQRDPARTGLRDALLQHPHTWRPGEWWRELRAGRSILVPDVSEALLHRLAADEEQRQLFTSIGVRSLMVVPIRLRLRGEVTALLSFVTTDESRRRYGPADLSLAEEIARRAAQLAESARLYQELKASEHRFRVALAAVKIAVFEQDADLRYRWYYNPDNAGDVIGKTHADLFPGDEAAQLTAIKQRVLDTGERARGELQLTVRSERIAYRYAFDPVRDPSGAIVGLMGAATDITAEKRVQEELAQTALFREQMMGILGHDLRSPLNAVTISAGLLRRQRDLPEIAREQALRIDHSARRMAEMIGTLLDFAQARFRGALPVSPVPADLGEIAREAVDELRAAWPDRQITLTLLGDPRGEWDPARIAQVVSNLVANALTHGADGAPVQVSVDGAGGEVTLSVRNAGPVIPPELMPVLFEPFRRGTDDRQSRGLGLGLYIAQQIVQAHDGSVEVASTAREGTTFSVHLPRALTHQARSEPAAHP